MMISDEEYIKFIENGQRYALEKLEELFSDNEDEVSDETDQ